MVFSLPEGVVNDHSTVLRVEHFLRLKPYWTALAGLVALVSAGFLGVRDLLKERRTLDSSTLAIMSVRAAGATFRACLGFAGFAAVLYLATVANGVVRHFALPNTAAFALNRGFRALAEDEPSLPYVLLAFGGIGVLVGWLSSLSPAALEVQREQERALTRRWRWSAPFIVVAAYLFCAAGPWAGVQRPGDNGLAIGGIVPFSDALGHFAGPLRQVTDGRFDSWVERRLVAAATRSVLALVVSYSAAAFLLLQVVLVGLATSASAWAVAKWRGIWAGVTYFALVYILVRPFLSTFLTEPLGLLWALVAIPFLTEALRGSSLTAGVAAFFLTCLALLTRMGSMFTIPAFALWLLWSAYRARQRLVATCCAVVLVIAACRA